MASFDEPGLFRVEDVPDKPHPQCLCYIVPWLPPEDEFLDKLLSGGFDEFLGV